MSYATVSSALSTRLSAVTGVGKVQTFTRWSIEDIESAAFQNLFVASSIVNVFMVTRTGFKREKLLADDTRFRVRHQIEVRGFYSLQDGLASGLTWQALLDTIDQNFRTGDRSLGGACLTYSDPQVSKIIEVMFGGSSQVLCHSATISFEVEEIL